MAQVLIMANRRRGRTAEAEPITIDTDHDGLIVLRLDDGQELELDATEVRRAMHEEAA